MDVIIARLRLLRGWFVVGFVVQSLVGTWAALRVIGWMQDAPFYGPALRAATPGLVTSSSLLATAGLLVLALWLFHELLRLRNWARLVLLVLGWLSVLGALSSLLSASSLPDLARWLPGPSSGADLAGLARVSVATNGLSLLLWGFVIAVLQFDRGVRDAFTPSPAGA